jgi:hypothetical protein
MGCSAQIECEWQHIICERRKSVSYVLRIGNPVSALDEFPDDGPPWRIERIGGQAGGQYGLSLLWVMLLLLPVCYFIQEMVVRLGIATGRGHAAMIYERFGKWWGRFSLFDLLLVNFLTLVTEFAAISLATQQMGISPNLSVPIAAVALIIHVTSGSYRRWERITCVLCLLDLTWVAMAIICHPHVGAIIRNTFIPSIPKGGFTVSLVFLVIAIVGTTIAPWQLFFQQSCVADKRLRFTDLKWARLDTFTRFLHDLCSLHARGCIARLNSQRAAPIDNSRCAGVGRDHTTVSDNFPPAAAERSEASRRSLG